MTIHYMTPSRKKDKTRSLKGLFKAAVLGVVFIAPYLWQSAEVARNAPEDGFQPDAFITVTGETGRILSALKIKDPEKPLFISGISHQLSDHRFEEILSELTGTKVSLKEDQIILGRKAKTTYGNAQEIAEWLRYNPNITKILVTSNKVHLARLSKEIERAVPANIEVRYVACGEDCALSPKRWVQLHITEIGKTFVSALDSQIFNDLKYGPYPTTASKTVPPQEPSNSTRPPAPF